jgi:hypothetical protein
MPEHDMTPDELERFEDEIVHRENEESGPASEQDRREKEPPEIYVPPSPD